MNDKVNKTINFIYEMKKTIFAICFSAVVIWASIIVALSLSSAGPYSGYLLTETNGGITPLGPVTLPNANLSYFNTTGTTVTVTAISDGTTNMVKVAPTTTVVSATEMDNGGSNDGRLRYTGAATRQFFIQITISFSPASPNELFVIGVAKNGVIDNDCKIIQRVGLTVDTQSATVLCSPSLATNDYIELYIGNMTSTADLVVKAINVTTIGF